jgi:hypothetical protein
VFQQIRKSRLGTAKRKGLSSRPARNSRSFGIKIRAASKPSFVSMPIHFASSLSEDCICILRLASSRLAIAMSRSSLSDLFHRSASSRFRYK